MKRVSTCFVFLIGSAIAAVPSFAANSSTVTSLLGRFKDSIVDLAWKPPVPQNPPSSNLVPYLSTGYKYLVVQHGQMDGFQLPGFDDSGFAIGAAPFASGGGCPLDNYINTNWPINTDILLRKHFTVSGSIHAATVTAAIDNDIQVFINGTDISSGLQSHEGCATRGSIIFDIPDSLVLNGDNVLAVRARDRGDESYVDVQLAGAITTQTTSTSVAYYNIYRSTDDRNFTLVKSSVTSTAFEDTGLVDGTTYYYKVRWVDAKGNESPDSVDVSATPTSQASRTAGLTPPTILSSPATQATIGLSYSYTPKASDPDTGDALTFSLSAGPAGMTINSATGQIQWAPSYAQSGAVPVKLIVKDKAGHFATESYLLYVVPPAVPQISSPPGTYVALGQDYTYQPVVSDANPSPVLTFALLASPLGATIDAQTGFVQWPPTAKQAGLNNLILSVSDQYGGTTQQPFNVLVDTLLPPMITSTPVIVASVGNAYSYQVTATDSNPGQTLAFSLTTALSGMTINATSGLIQWTPTMAQEGSQNVAVTVKDQLGRSSTQSFSVVVYPPLLPPTITLNSPVPNATITQLTSIIGSIIDPNGTTGGPFTWTVGILKPGASSYQTIASGNASVTNGAIAQFDPTLLSNNVYPVRVTANKGPFTRTADVLYSVAGNLKLGQFSVQFTDLSIPVAGIPITICRRYNSLDTSTGEFGAGWRLALPGQINDSAQGNAFTVLTRIYVTRPDGKREGFTFSPVYQGLFLPVWFPAFTPDPGVTDTLSVSPDSLFYSGGGFYDISGTYDPTEFALTTKYGVKYELAEVGGLQKVTFPNGNTLTVTASGIVSSTGVSIAFQRDSLNRITTMTDPKQNVVHYSYDTAGRLSQVRDENNKITTFVYQGASNYLTGINAPGGCHPVTTRYDSTGRVTSTTDSAGNQTLHTYDPVNRNSTLTNSLNGMAAYTYDGNGNAIQVADASGTVTYAYDANNNETSRTMPSGLTLSHTYDAQSNPLTFTIKPTSGMPLTTNFAWNAQNLLTSIVYPSGKKSVLTYDAVGNLTGRQSQDSNGTVLFSESFAYDPASGIQLTKTDGLGNTTKYTYDSFFDLASATDATGVTFKYTHDADGNVITKTDGLGNILNLGYDAANNLASITVAGESQPRSSFTYDNQNKLTSYTDGLGNQTLYTQSCNELLSSISDASGSKTAYMYNGLQAISSITDANNQTTNFSYDTANRFLSRTDPDASGVAYTYSADSVQQNATTPTANIRRSFDGYGSVSSEVRPEKTISLAYDVDRNLTQTTETGGLGTRTTSYTYDGANRVASVTDWQNRTVNYKYNLRGQIASVRSPEGATTTYSYDNAGRILLVQTGTDSARYVYDSAGRRIQETFSNGVVTNYSYDVFGRITGTVTKDSSSNVIASYTYTRDANGNVVSAAVPDGQLSYKYDVEQRLTEEKSSSTSLGAYDHVFPYDAVGNRLDSNAAYSSGNRLVSNSGGLFSYDNSGNRTTRGTQSYSYDSLNRLVSYSGASPATYEYDAMYNRVAKTANGVRREFVYQDNRILDEYQNGAVVGRYTLGGQADEVLFVRRNSQTYFYHTDALGSVVAITDGIGHMVQRYGYDAWGNILLNSGSFSFNGTGLVNTFTFTGREYDVESRLYYYRARAYDPAIGRFLQKDALQGDLYKPLSQNRYAYVSGNPVNSIDPTGNEELTETALILNSAGLKAVFAEIGYLQGYAITQIDFVGQYLGIVNEVDGGGNGLGDTPLDASQIWALALKKATTDIDKIKNQVKAKDFPDGTQGVVGAYLDGADANDVVADFNKTFIAIQSLDGISESQQSKVRDLKTPPSYGGFGSGTTFGLDYLKALVPK